MIQLSTRSIKNFIKSHNSLRIVFDPFIPRESKLLDAWMYLFSAVEEGSLVVRIPEFAGLFEFGCRSDILRCLLVYREFEPEVAEIVKQRVNPAKDVIDVGANIGLYTVLIAGLISESRRLLAIEPTPSALQYLRRNINRNGHARKVIVFDGVAAESRGSYVINVLDGREEYSSLGALVLPGLSEQKSTRVPVQGDTIDNLVETFGLQPGFIKMDTEGAEYRVLSGAVRTIQQHRPIILSECSDVMLTSSGASAQMLTDWLKAQDYTVSPATKGEILAVPNESVR